MSLANVCVLVALFIVFLAFTGVIVMMNEFQSLDEYRRNLKHLLKDTTIKGNSEYETKLRAEAVELLSNNAKRVANGTATYQQGHKCHRSICIEYFEFCDYREKLMCTYDTLVQRQQQQDKEV
jgi:hypothetical protein